MDGLPQVIGSRFTNLQIIGKGSYGIVYRANDLQDAGAPVALKCMKNIFRHAADASRVLREIKLLRLLSGSDDVVQLKTILLPDKKNFKDLVLVFELFEADLHQVIKLNPDLQPEHHQWFLFQMIRCLSYMHQANILHRDLKPRNILVNSDCKVKICDLGLARPASDTDDSVAWTDYVATRWYRAPELCGSFGAKYTHKVDICYAAAPMFPGKNVVHQLDVITDVLGTPPVHVIAKIQNLKARKYLAAMPNKCGYNLRRVFHKTDPLGIDLLQRMLTFDPDERITAQEALRHPFFDNLQMYQHDNHSINISPSEFAFDEAGMSKDDVQELMYLEILQYHPDAQKAHSALLPHLYVRSLTSPCNAKTVTMSMDAEGRSTSGDACLTGISAHSEESQPRVSCLSDPGNLGSETAQHVPMHQALQKVFGLSN